MIHHRSPPDPRFLMEPERGMQVDGSRQGRYSERDTMLRQRFGQMRKASHTMDETVDKVGIAIVRDQIHEYIVMNFLYDGGADALDDDTPLLEQGVVDATGILEVALFVEDTYGILVTQDDLVPENFDSVRTIAAFVVEQIANL